MKNIFEGRSQSKEVEKKLLNTKVGLSLSRCVSDILSGKVKEEEIKEIIAGTNSSLEQREKLIKMYRELYWKENPDEGERICRRLYAEGKIRQPRQEGEVSHNISQGHWIAADKVYDLKKGKEIE